ncbi:hypothetical protein CEXT_756591 [Caerostris extrusa]|uniref:Uncharacterized protein n=1 Tax=Caerostris extrusa TaxID=172846 RepID=A0AAV4UH10_CAEEX|nr:hypothetical protein CEXT_756591 [Caerostris extrusa]
MESLEWRTISKFAASELAIQFSTSLVCVDLKVPAFSEYELNGKCDAKAYASSNFKYMDHFRMKILLSGSMGTTAEKVIRLEAASEQVHMPESKNFSNRHKLMSY